MQRTLFLVIAGFWLVMNALLIQSEYGSGRDSGSTVPLAGVWHKILTAPDDSALAVLHQGKRVGHLRWVPNVGEELATGKLANQEFMPEGMVGVLRDYSIDIEGNLHAGVTSRIRFTLGAKFDTNHHWKEFTVRAGNRPSLWSIKGSAQDQVVQIQHDSFDRRDWEQTISLEMLKNPDTLMAALGLAAGNPLIGSKLPMPPAGLPPVADLKSAGESLLDRLKWKASQDWLTLGHSKVRVYKIEARLGEGGMKATVWISKVGELLRIDLPGEVVLVNEALEHFPSA